MAGSRWLGCKFAPDFIGRLFGDESAVTAEAPCDVELCVMPKAALEQMIADAPALGQRLMQQTLRELDEARDWMVTLGRKTAPERVASFLLLIAEHADPEREAEVVPRFELPLLRGDIADFPGLTIETVSRQLTQLKSHGVIGIEGRWVEVGDVEGLRARAG